MAGESKFSLIDLGSLSKPASKLIDAVRSGVGLLYEPTHVRRMARALADAEQIKQERALDLVERAQARIVAEELRRQANREAIVAGAIEALPETVSDDAVDEDWISEFFGFCENISNEMMQSIWSRLLAGEVARPSSFSLQTLSVVRVMTPADAELFQRFCRYLMLTNEKGRELPSFVAGHPHAEPYLNEHGVYATGINHLVGLGLVAGHGAFGGSTQGVATI